MSACASELSLFLLCLGRLGGHTLRLRVVSSCWGGLGAAPVREPGKRTGQEEKLTRDVVTAQSSADPMGRATAGMALQSCPKEEGGAWAVVSPHILQALGGGCPWRGCNFGGGQFLEREPAVCSQRAQQGDKCLPLEGELVGCTASLYVSS